MGCPIISCLKTHIISHHIAINLVGLLPCMLPKSWNIEVNPPCSLSDMAGLCWTMPCTTLSPNRVRCVCTIAGVEKRCKRPSFPVENSYGYAHIAAGNSELPIAQSSPQFWRPVSTRRAGWVLLVDSYTYIYNIYIKNHKEFIVTQKPYLYTWGVSRCCAGLAIPSGVSSKNLRRLYTTWYDLGMDQNPDNPGTSHVQTRCRHRHEVCKG